jgi:hypothetical protein
MSGPIFWLRPRGVSALDESFAPSPAQARGAAARRKSFRHKTVLVWDPHGNINRRFASGQSRHAAYITEMAQHQKKLATHPTVAAALALASSQGDLHAMMWLQRKDVAALYPLGYQVLSQHFQRVF